MKTSHRGLLAIEAREGVRLRAYRDSKGLPTIGIGHLIVPGDGFNMSSRITQEQCDALFAEDIKVYENAVNSCIKVPLKQHQFDALVSICLNIGAGQKGFKGSTIVKRINRKDFEGAAEAIMFWKKPPEIKGRRRSEQKQFLTPYPNSAAGPASVTPEALTEAADGFVPPVDAVNESNSAAQPPTIQNAENIINTGDAATLPPAEDKTLTAPPKDGSTATATKTTLLGIGVPTGVLVVVKSIQDLIEKGFVSAADIGSTVISFIRENQKWVFILIGVFIAFLAVKKIIKQVTFWIEMLTHAIPGWNNITVVPHEEPPPPTTFLGLFKK